MLTWLVNRICWPYMWIKMLARLVEDFNKSVKQYILSFSCALGSNGYLGCYMVLDPFNQDSLLTLEWVDQLAQNEPRVWVKQMILNSLLTLFVCHVTWKSKTMSCIDNDFNYSIDARNFVQLKIRLSMVCVVLCVAVAMPICLPLGWDQILIAPSLVVATLAFLVGHP